ncbi:MAG: ParA family protein [Chloroflexota bacterium]|nr:MAG: chromosome partitioning protein ParA [Chloroflexota bacterium]
MPSRIISVANQKGGVGKTATTTNLGTSLFDMGHRVLLVDMDPQGNLSSSFGSVSPTSTTIADALLDRQVSVPVQTVYSRDGAVLDLVPAAVSLATAEAALLNKLGREFRLREQLASLADRYDFIFIDTPPSLGLLTINSLVAAQLVLVPTEARYFSLQGLHMLQESIDEILYINPHLRIVGILLSKFDRRLREEQTVAAYLREHWGDLVFSTSVGTNSKILEAASSGVPLIELNGSQRAVETYRSLAREVLGRV